MPTNTFEALATTVVSGTSTNAVTFSGLNTSTYKNFIIIGSCRASGNDNYTGIFVNGISSYSYYEQKINCQSQQTGGVPVSSIDNANFLKASTFQTSSNSGSNLVFRTTITNASAGRTNMLTESLNFNAGNNTLAWCHHNGYINASLSSITIQCVGSGNFGNTSTFSIYGLV